ncbi:site-2 protease family protein [Persephonella sp.]|uniref:site-2 protease family protein n=1 Tax=Persephonella sp. TaxID=2060922 RepID=UPI0026095B68|nr:site-2 protease family protein [Persephonella sp.]
MDFNILELIFMVPALLFAVIIHELGHGIIAYRLGDPTPKISGRLTFNPIPHIDPLGSIILPALLLLIKAPFLFGWAKPVPINPLNFKKLGYRKGMAITAFAGPGINFVAAVFFGVLYQLLSSQSVLVSMASIFGVGFIRSIIFPILIFLKYSVSINVILAIFNLIPIPPLDGGRILMSLLPPHLERKMEPLEQWGFYIVIILLAVGALNFIIIAPYRFFTTILLGS